MKKLICLIALAFLFLSCQNSHAWTSWKVSQVIDETLDNDPTSKTSDGVFIGTAKKVAFLIVMDETVSADDASVLLTVEVSPDNSTWVDYDVILDANGTDGPVANINYTADDDDVAYLPGDFTAPWIRVVATGTNTDAADYYAVDVWLCIQK